MANNRLQLPPVSWPMNIDKAELSGIPAQTKPMLARYEFAILYMNDQLLPLWETDAEQVTAMISVANTEKGMARDITYSVSINPGCPPGDGRMM
ncbi:MAG: hypothetical protein OEL83_02805 [Desulforhopalus sp.]|nr:hypothetical protein [Desulforhopalus sp.]